MSERITTRVDRSIADQGANTTMRQRFIHMTTAVLASLMVLGMSHAAPLSHFHGTLPETSDTFEAEGTWAVTLAAYCYEGFGFVEARVFSEDGDDLGVVTVMGEGVERLVLETDPGRYYIEVTPSFWHVYTWELLVETGEGSDYEYGVELLTVSHAEHQAAQEADEHEGHDSAMQVSDEEMSIFDGVFNADQVRRGRFAYNDHCAMCHGDDLISADGYAPDLIGSSFASRWIGETVEARRERIQTTMPVGRGGTLEDQMVLDMIAYILDFNDYPQGDGELVPGDHLEDLIIEPQD
jgi:mono/diheme cytochrome c family protein